MTDNIKHIAIRHRYKYNPAPDKIRFFSGKEHMRQIVQDAQHFLMSVYPDFLCISFPLHFLGEHPDQPHHTKDVIHMAVCDKNIMNIFPAHACRLKLFQDAIPAAPVYKKISIFII